MKPVPARPVPGNTEAERFYNAICKTITVSKREMQRREAEWQLKHDASRIEAGAAPKKRRALSGA
jgi:hypothetical protein